MITCEVKQDGTAIECQWPQTVPEGYFKRLFSPENTPNIALFFVGIGGIIVALCTLKTIARQTKATEDTAMAASNSSEAGKAAVEAARAGTKVLISTQRAFICFIGEGRIVTRIDESGGITGYDFQLSFENSGSTPATDVSMQFNAHWREDDLPADYSYPDYGASGYPMMVGPKIRQFGFGPFVPREEVKAMIEGKKRIYFYGWAEYKDIFFPETPVHRTEYCFRLTRFKILDEKQIMIQLSAHSNHNNAT
jgi:hypothetical protein